MDVFGGSIYNRIYDLEQGVNNGIAHPKDFSIFNFSLKWHNKSELTPSPPSLSLSNNLLRPFNWQWNENAGTADLHKSP